MTANDVPPFAHGVDLRGKIVGMSKRAATVGEPVEVRLTAPATYFRGSQTPRKFTCMAQPDLGRPLNHA